MARDQWHAERVRAVAEARAEGRTEGATKVVASGADAELRRLRGECVVLKATLASREAELSRTRKSTSFTFDVEPEQPEAHETWSPGTFRRTSVGEAERQRRTKRRRMIAVAVAAGVAACAVAFHREIEELVGKAAQAEEHGVVEASAPAPAPVSAVLIRAATVRAAPSSSAEVILTLQRGAQVELLDQVGVWRYVRFARKNGAAAPQDGWVDSSLVKQAKPDAE